MSARQLIDLAALLSDWNPDTEIRILDDQGRELSFGMYRCENVIILDTTLDSNNDSKEA